MVVNFIKCLGQIYSTEICCAAKTDKFIDNLSSSVNGIITTDALLKSILVVSRCKCIAESVQKAIFKNFRENWADGNASEVNTSSN